MITVCTCVRARAVISKIHTVKLATPSAKALKLFYRRRNGMHQTKSSAFEIDER